MSSGVTPLGRRNTSRTRRPNSSPKFHGLKEKGQKCLNKRHFCVLSQIQSVTRPLICMVRPGNLKNRDAKTDRPDRTRGRKQLATTHQGTCGTGRTESNKIVSPKAHRSLSWEECQDIRDNVFRAGRFVVVHAGNKNGACLDNAFACEQNPASIANLISRVQYQQNTYDRCRSFPQFAS